MMISYRKSDLINRLEEQNPAVITCYLVMHVPQRRIQGRYVASLALMSPSKQKIANETLLNKIENAIGQSITENIIDTENYEWTVFIKYIRRHLIKKLQPICVEPITTKTDDPEVDGWILNLKIGNRK